MVIPQRSLDHTDRVKDLNIDVFVVGDDWRGKYDYLRDLGVEVYYFPYGEGVSTTRLKQQITEQYNKLKSTADKHENPEIKKS